jgi:hypothetical protein
MSKEECLNANWNDVGLKDGIKGRDVSRLNGYVKSCAKTNITPDETAYTKGRNKGLKSFCTIQNGYAQGIKNKEYYGVCVDHNEARFLEGRTLGLELYAAEASSEHAAKKVKDTNDEIAKIETEISNLESDIRQNKITSAEKNTKQTLISRNKINLSAFKHTKTMLTEKSEAAMKNYQNLKQKHENLGYCQDQNCFNKQ